MKRVVRERQEELALDMKILEQVLEESRNEAEETLQKKLQRKDEERKYREYLQQQVRPCITLHEVHSITCVFCHCKIASSYLNNYFLNVFCCCFAWLFAFFFYRVVVIGLFIIKNFNCLQYEEEKRREKELDRLVEEDVKMMWAKRLHQWRLEKEARHRLMQDVMETRRKQLQEKRKVFEIVLCI